MVIISRPTVQIYKHFELNRIKFSYLSVQTFDLDAQKNIFVDTVLLSAHINEATLLSIQNICFG